MTPAELIKRARTEAKLSQVALERLSGLAHGHICKIEARKCLVTIATFRRIATALKCDILIELVKKE